MWRTPIFDRTLDDANYARQHPEAVEDLKGALNYSDLNRIEENFKYVAQRLLERGVYIDLVSRNFLETWWNSQEASTDPDTDFNTVLLLHAEDFTDASVFKHEIVNSGATIVEGKFGNGFNFTNLQKVETTSSLVDTSGKFTVEFWCKQRQLNQYCTYIGGVDNNSFKIQLIDGKIGFDVHGLNVKQKTDFQPTLNEWFHVALTGNNKTFSFFINGKKVKTFSVTQNIVNGNMRIGLNFNQDNGGSVEGIIDELRISDIVRYTEDFELQNKPFDIYILDTEERPFEESETFVDWQMRNILWLSEINRIRKNFNTLNSVYPKNTNIPNSKESNYINYEEVNNWEKAAYEANEAVDRMDKIKRYCGTFNCGGDPL